MLSSRQEPFSDRESLFSKKATKLEKFIRSISPGVVKQMEIFLKNYKPSQEQSKDRNKIHIFQDIYAIYTLKMQEQTLFNARGTITKVLQKIATKLKRSFNTIKDRFRKKLCQLTGDQLSYLMRTNKSLIFRENTNIINTDSWPQHLKKVKTQHQTGSDEDNFVNLDSSEHVNESIIMKSRYKPQRRPQREQKQGNFEYIEQFQIKKQEKQKKQKINGIQKVETNFNEPQWQETNRYQRHQTNLQRQKSIKDQKIYDLTDPKEKDIFLEGIVGKWKQKHFKKDYFESNKMLLQSKVCYNFRQREYMFLNPQVMRSVWNNLNQQCLINDIKSKKNNQEKSNNKKSSQFHKNENEQKSEVNHLNFNKNSHNEEEIQIESGPIFYDRQEDIMRNINNKKVKETEQNRLIISKDISNLSNKRNNHNSNISPIIELSQKNETFLTENNQEECTNQPKSIENKCFSNIEDPQKMLEEIVSKYDMNQINAQARQLIKKAFAIIDRIEKQTGQKSTKQKQIIQDQADLNMNDLWFQEQQDKLQKESNKSETKPMVYWFNNDPHLYETYQNNPYQMGHLLWAEQEDQLIINADKNIKDHINAFKALIHEKTPQYLLTRLKFLKINPSSQLYTILSEYLSPNQV